MTVMGSGGLISRADAGLGAALFVSVTAAVDVILTAATRVCARSGMWLARAARL